MLGFDAGSDPARGDRVGFAGEGRVSPPGCRVSAGSTIGLGLRPWL